MLHKIICSVAYIRVVKLHLNTVQYVLKLFVIQGRFGEEIGNDQFGASIMIHAKHPNTQEAKAYIENVEITYAGQAFRLGR